MVGGAWGLERHYHIFRECVNIVVMIGVSISEAKQRVGCTVQLRGFVHTIRNQKKMFFLVLRDRSGKIQITIAKSSKAGQRLLPLVEKLNRESAIAVKGKVVENEEVKLGGVELIPEVIELLSDAEEKLPIDPWSQQQASLDKRLDWRFLDLRRDDRRLIFEIQTSAEKAMRDWWYNHGFIEIHSPKLIGTASESGSELFTLDYFDRVAYLAQSPQFYKQMAMAAGFEAVFEIGPVFRANPSFTSRHDTEFTSVDVEVSWISSHEDLMEIEEQWLQYVIKRVYEEYYNKIKEFFGVELKIPQIPFPRMTLQEAKSILDELGYTPPEDSKDEDLDPGGEKKIGQYVKERYGSDFVFITDYPASIRPFYHMRKEGDQELTKSFDLLWNGLEVTTGAQREHRYEILKRQASEKNLDTDVLDFYLNFFRYGIPPHGGYGFGLTRMLMSMLQLPNVREATYLYRGPNRLYP